MDQELELLLARHCAPTLAGIKTANLLSLPRADFPGLPARLSHYNRVFGKKGLRFEAICACRERCLLLVYRPARLMADLADSVARSILAERGYPVDGSLDELLDALRVRIAESADFPHEIGLFLGYPSADVKGFIEQGGQGSKLSGYWKVYGDANEAERLFERFRRCSRATLERVESGTSLRRLFAA